MSQPPKLADIAQRIGAHLRRIEAAHPDRNTKDYRYHNAAAWTAGSRVGVRYVSFQVSYFLSKADALTYLNWLDAGNEGKHAQALAADQRSTGSNETRV